MRTVFIIIILLLSIRLHFAVHGQDNGTATVQPNSPITIEVIMPSNMTMPDGSTQQLLIPVVQKGATAEDVPRSYRLEPFDAEANVEQPFTESPWAILTFALLALMIAYLAFVYIFLAQPYNVPLTLVLNPARIFRTVPDYSRFVATVNDQSPLAQLLVLCLPIYGTTPLLSVRKLLEDQGIPASIDDIKTALTTLVHDNVLVRDSDRYSFEQALLPGIYRRVNSPEQVADLARKVRAENPIYSNALRFFVAADLTATELVRGELLLRPRQPYDRERLGNTVYTRMITDRALQAADIRLIHAAARRIYQSDLAGRTAFVVVDHTPEAED